MKQGSKLWVIKVFDFCNLTKNGKGTLPEVIVVDDTPYILLCDNHRGNCDSPGCQKERHGKFYYAKRRCDRLQSSLPIWSKGLTGELCAYCALVSHKGTAVALATKEQTESVKMGGYGLCIVM